jgi:hypothetical protein
VATPIGPVNPAGSRGAVVDDPQAIASLIARARAELMTAMGSRLAPLVAERARRYRPASGPRAMPMTADDLIVSALAAEPDGRLQRERIDELVVAGGLTRREAIDARYRMRAQGVLWWYPGHYYALAGHPAPHGIEPAPDIQVPEPDDAETPAPVEAEPVALSDDPVEAALLAILADGPSLGLELDQALVGLGHARQAAAAARRALRAAGRVLSDPSTGRWRLPDGRPPAHPSNPGPPGRDG